MKTSAKLLASLAGALTALVTVAGAASAQSIVDPTVTPVENKSGWGPLGPFISLAWLTAIAAGLIALIIIILYMRYAPRFAKDEESSKVVRADRVLPGQAPPRRSVDLSQAVPVVVQPPAIPAAVSAAPAAAPPAAAGPAPATPAPATPAPATPAPATPAPATPAPAEAPAATPASEEAPAATPASEETPAATPASEEAPAATPASEEAPAAPPAAAPAPAAASAEERPEVPLDQETYDKTLEELLGQGTDRRIAEGKARRTAMIVARQKAAGGA